MGSVRVRVLGEFEVEGFDARALGSRKARTLLKILALERGRPVSVDRLIDGLWPEGAPARPAEQVAVIVSRLRSVLGSHRIVHSDAGYRLALDWLDLDAMAAVTEEAARRLAGGSPGLASAAAQAALGLARGPLLADEPDAPWAMADRLAANRLESRALVVAAEASLAMGLPADAAELAERGLAHDAFDEVALRVLMTAHVAAGRPGSALDAYRRARSLLAEELGVSPSAETETLHAAILRDEPLAGVPSAPPLSAPAPWPGPVLPGRGPALAELDAALGAVHTSIELVVVEGEAGIGKSQLLATWAEQVAAIGCPVLRGRCDELGRALPLQPVLDAVEDHLRAGHGEPVALLGPHAAVLAPLLTGATGRGDEMAPGAIADPETGRARLFSALLGVLARVGAGRTAVLILDDVHLADPSTVAWLHVAVRRGSGVPALIVAAQRPDVGPRLPPARTVELGPLDLAAAEALVGAERVLDLHARSGGNPLLLAELAAADPDDTLPTSILESVTARCERTGPAEMTLRGAAVIGPEVDLDLLAAVLGLPPVELLDHLESGARHRFLEERHGRFLFRHELVREALAAGTTAARRALLHREAGRVLAARGLADPLVVAHHARLGGDDQLAALALARAAGVAVSRHDHAEAERLLDDALASHDTPDVRITRGRVRLARGRYDEAGSDASAALARGGGAPAMELAGWVAYYQRDFSAALSLADDGARLADDPVLRAGCLLLGGRIRHSRGELVDAEERLEESTGILRGPSLAVASVWLGALRVHQGRTTEAVALLRSATRPGTALAHPFAAAHAHLAAAHALGLQSRAHDALAEVADAEVEITRQGLTHFAGRVDNYRAWILRNLGMGEAADEANQRAAEAAREGGHEEAGTQALLDLADGRLRRGDADGAAVALSRAAEWPSGNRVNRWRAELRAGLLNSRHALAVGRPEDALAAAQAVGADSRAYGAPRYLVFARVAEVHARAALGEPVDLDETGETIDRLAAVAGMESWWLTAELAAACSVEPWWDQAEARVAALAAHAGPHAETFVGLAASLLERMRTNGRNG